jgi:hypothetical protein
MQSFPLARNGYRGDHDRPDIAPVRRDFITIPMPHPINARACVTYGENSHDQQRQP